MSEAEQLSELDALKIAIQSQRLEAYLNSHHIPDNLWTKRIEGQPEPGSSAMQEAVCTGQFQHIPKKIITKENLQAGDNLGYSTIHLLAELGELSQLHESIISEELLLTEDDAFWTPYHSAAAYGHAEQIPLKYWTEKTLTWADQEGNCPCDLIIKSNQLDALLGIDLPQEMKHKLGEQWWQKNEGLKADKKRLADKEEKHDIELF